MAVAVKSSPETQQTAPAEPRLLLASFVGAVYVLASFAVVLYGVPKLWAAGVTQGMMWRATGPDGMLSHSFIASLIATQPYYVARFLGGVLVLAGMVVMAWNLWHTASNARERLIKPIVVPIPEPEPVQVPAPLPAPAR